MQTVARDAVVVLIRDAMTDPKRDAPLVDQTVEITKAGVPAVIGIDGHTGFWDALVEVHWSGAHLHQLDQVGHVEIRDGAGHILESLPVNGTREPYEKGGETVFFLTDME